MKVRPAGRARMRAGAGWGNNVVGSLEPTLEVVSKPSVSVQQLGCARTRFCILGKVWVRTR